MLIAPTPRLRTTLASLTLCAFAYLYVSPYFPRINNPNENVRLYMTAALVLEGRYEIDTLRARWGWVNDAAAYGGHYYSVKAPGTSLLGIPAYSLLHALDADHDRAFVLYMCRLSASVLPTLLFLFFFHRFLGRTTFDPVLRESVFFSVALGSVLYGYGLLFVSHTQSAACAFGAFMLLVADRDAPMRGWHAFAAGLLAAGVTFFEYPGALCSMALSALALWRMRSQWRMLSLFVLGGLIPTLAVMHFQYSAFGNPFLPGHLYVENQHFRAAHEQGLYGAVGISEEALYGLLLDPGAGLLPLTPILVLALPGVVTLGRDRIGRAWALCSLVICLGTILIIASMNNWRGGWTVGPRYLVLTIPFLGWLALVFLQNFQTSTRHVSQTLAVGALVTGLMLSGVPSTYYPHLPPEITRPLHQLIPVLVRDDFAPKNAGNWLGLYGSASMVPLMLGMVLVMFRSAGQRLRGPLAPGLLLGLLLTTLLCIEGPHDEKKTRSAVGFVTRTWAPVGHDRAARLAMAVRKHPSPEGKRALVQLYRSEGRGREADALEATLRTSKNR